MSNTTLALIILLGAVLLAVVALLSYKGKGPLLSNAYMYAVRSGQKDIDKALYYKQSAVSMGAGSLTLVIIAVAVLKNSLKLSLLALPVVLGAYLYSYITTYKIRTGQK